MATAVADPEVAEVAETVEAASPQLSTVTASSDASASSNAATTTAAPTTAAASTSSPSPSPSRSPVSSAIPPAPAVPTWVLPGLPHVSGPYVVGTTDIEWAEPQFAELVVDGAVTNSKGLFVRLFYPANQRRQVHPAPYRTPSMPGYRRSRWLPDPKYAVGYGDFLKIPRAVTRSVVAPVFNGVDMPDAFADAPFLTVEVEGGADAAVRPRLPVMVFSHGLGGMRTTYSAICAELASYGWVVAAVEHSDRSACLSLRDGGARAIEFFRTPKVSDPELRTAQVARRIDEAFACVDLLQRLHNGEPIERIPAATAKNSGGAPLDLSTLRGRLDLGRLAISGHSYGGATAVGASADPRSRFRCVLALDAWLFPLGPKFAQTHARTCPVLFVNSETFQWKENLDAITAWVDADSTTGSGSGAGTDANASATKTAHDGLVVTLLQTAHQNQSDFPLLLPTILRAVKMAGPLAPTTAIHLNNRAMLSFLHKHVPHCMPPTEDDAKDVRLPQDPAHLWYHTDPVLDRASPERPALVRIDYPTST